MTANPGGQITSWKGWIEYHARMFGLVNDEPIAMIGTWARLFSSAGFTPAEAVDATNHMALHEQPKMAADHRLALLAFMRQKHKGLDRAIPHETHGCSLCKHTGSVEVPHPLWVKGQSPGGRWYDYSVYCSCALGVQLHREHVCRVETYRAEPFASGARFVTSPVAGARLATIEHYEDFNPNWRAQLAKRREEALAHSEARAAEESLVRFGPLIARLKREAPLRREAVA